MADKFDEFLEEVENDIRQERWMGLWQKYGKMATTALTVAVAIAGAYMAWQSYDYHQREKSADRFLHAQDLIAQGENMQALTDFAALAKDSKAIYPILAQFNQAALLGQDGPQKDIAAAGQLYEDLAKNTKIDAAWRGLATLFHVTLLADHTPLEQTQSLLDQLKPLLNKENPWFALASEIQGALLYRLGDIPGATSIFVQLAKDKNTPEGVMVRAQLMTQVLSGDGLPFDDGKDDGQSAVTPAGSAEDDINEETGDAADVAEKPV